MKLYKVKDWEGFKVDDIRRAVDLETWVDFWESFNGQAGGIHKGRLYVYKHDWKRFVKTHNAKTFDGKTIK